VGFCFFGGKSMSNISAAMWSAIAASFSAIAAIIMVFITRRNMLDSARPELILSGWDRKPAQAKGQNLDKLTFNKIKNIGKGSALQVSINLAKLIKDKPAAIMITKSFDILPPNEECEIDGDITLYWDNVTQDHNGVKYLPIDLKILSWCSKNYRHETKYKIVAVKSSTGHIVTGGNEIARGVILTTRTTVSKSVRGLKMLRKLSRLPAIGKYVPKDR
jgi:hypothetical protein